MNKKNIVRILFSILLLVSAKAFAGDWHVCLGSYKNRSNATELEQKLKKGNLDVFITEYKKNENEILYRVVLKQKSDTWNQCTETKKQMERNETIKKLGIKNLWCVDLPEIATNTAVAENNGRNEIIVEKFIEVIKEVPVEVIKEVPIEVIKEVVKEVPVEVVKEVPVEVIKEVPVEVTKEVPADETEDVNVNIENITEESE